MDHVDQIVVDVASYLVVREAEVLESRQELRDHSRLPVSQDRLQLSSSQVQALQIRNLAQHDSQVLQTVRPFDQVHQLVHPVTRV